MRKFILSFAALCAFALAVRSAPAPAVVPKLKLLVVSGGHSYDTAQFNLMWKSFPQFDVTFQVLKVGNEIFDDVSHWNYDVLVFYNEQDPGAKFTDQDKANFLSLTDRGVGLVIMHHAVASYPFWPEFEKIAGVKYTSHNFYPPTADVSFAKLYVTHDIMVLDTADPVVKGVARSFTTRDEAYRNMHFAADDHLLMRTHEVDADTPLAWTRHYGNSRVFATVLGHGPNKAGDPNIFAEPFFRSMMSQGVTWTVPCPYPPCGSAVAPAAPKASAAGDRNGLYFYGPWPASDETHAWWDASGRRIRKGPPVPWK